MGNRFMTYVKSIKLGIFPGDLLIKPVNFNDILITF